MALFIGLSTAIPAPLTHRNPAATATPPGQSVFPLRPDDPTAFYFSAPADGKTDVSDALQQAIRTVKTRYNFGIVFIPEGKYLITKTIYVPTAIRLIGYGKSRHMISYGLFIEAGNGSRSIE